MNVISFFNHAGGAGKSSTARDIGYILGQRGFRVLMIDADSQANLSEFFGLDTSELSPDDTVYAAVMGKSTGELAFPKPLQAHGVSVIPSHLKLAEADRVLASQIGGYQRLQAEVRKLTGYDFVIIDCPPNLGTMAIAALVASEHVVIPVQLRKKFRDGLWTVIKTIRDGRALCPALSPLAVIPTQTDNTVVSRENLEYLNTEFGPSIPILSPIARRPAAYGEAEEVGTPIAAYQPNSDAAREVETVTDQILEQLGVGVGV